MPLRLLAALSAPLLLSCDTVECSLEDCPAEGVTLTLDHATWAPGTYQLEVIADGTSYACSLTVPSSNISAQYCGNGGVVLVGIDTTTGAPVDIYLDGDEVEQITVNLTLDGAALANAEYAVVWDKTYPNGPGCPPPCYEARTTISF